MAKRRNRRLRIETLLSETAEPVFLLNAEREVVFFNPACESLTGRAAAQVVGLCCRYHGPAGTLNLPDLAASLAPPPEVMQGRPATVRSLFIRPDGERLWRQIHFFPCHDSSMTLVSVIGLVSEQVSEPAEPPSPQAELHEGLLKLRDRLYGRFGFDKIVGSGAAMARVLEQVRLAAKNDIGIFIWGEPGTGKNLLARTIHLESGRKAGPFLPIDSALLPGELIERDLFGADRQESAASRSARPGLVQSAQGGTLFLKNLSKMPRDTQSRLADVLRDQSMAGKSESKKPAGVRVIAADIADPARSRSAEKLRSDVYLALSPIEIALPPLRERKEDFPLLAQLFVELANTRGEKQVSGLDAAAIELLLAYDWPGNVRELGEVLTEAHDRCRFNVIMADDISLRIQGARGGAFAAPAVDQRLDLDTALAETERKLIEQAIKRARGNKSAAAELLSISRPRLYRRMQVLGMDGAEDE